MSNLVLCLTGLKDSAIRGAVSSDGVHVFSVTDFISKACQFKERDAGAQARKEFKRLTDDGSEFQAEIMGLCRLHKFPGVGQRSTPVMTIRGMQRLLAILGSKVASDYRAIVESTFTRILTGDTSLVRPADRGAPQDALVSHAGGELVERDSGLGLCSESGSARAPDDLAVADGVSRKRRIEMREFEFAVEMEERWSRLRDQALTRTERMVDILMKLRPNEKLDERTVSQIEDQAKSIVMNCGSAVAAGFAPQTLPGPIPAGAEGSAVLSAAPAAGGEFLSPPSNSISVSLVAGLMGKKFTLGQLKEIGKRMAVRYREAHQRDPVKHHQKVGTGMVAVNSYTEADRGMMEQVIREYAGAD